MSRAEVLVVAPLVITVPEHVRQCAALAGSLPPEAETLLIATRTAARLRLPPGVQEGPGMSVAAVWNAGLARAAAQGKVALILNQDVVLEEGSAERLVRFYLEHPEFVLVAGLEASAEDAQGPAVPEWTEDLGKNAFSCFVADARLLAAVGSFDENFRPAYFEDQDLLRRIRLAGARVAVLRTAPYRHVGSGAIGADTALRADNDQLFPRNRAYYLRKWGGPPGEEVFRVPFGVAPEERRLTILAFSDAGADTGFAVVADQFYRRWCAAGHTVHVDAVNYRGDPYDAPYQLYPATKYNPQDSFGLSRTVELLQRVRPDVVFMLNDLPVLQRMLFENPQDPHRLLAHAPLVLYVPVDCVGLPRYWFAPVHAARRTVVQSRWGAEVLAREGGVEADWLWHGVDHDHFYPVSSRRPLTLRRPRGDGFEELTLRSKREAKALHRLEDKFVVLSVNRNSLRKNLADTVRAFAEFARDKADAVLYLHAAVRDEGGDLAALLERFGVREQALVTANLDTFQGVGKEALCSIYNLGDVFLSTSCGEGFGLTTAEAMACGLPVVAQDFSATTELVGDAGILVPPQRFFTTARGVDLAYPDLAATVAALNRLYQSRGLRRELGRRAVERARRFDWDQAAEAFGHILQEVARGEPVGAGGRMVTVGEAAAQP
ncbi:MAG: glycosyltransferase [Thermaerobacter sp.]|nr:glycosyltransferase [Thermaerobacter sp.]